MKTIGFTIIAGIIYLLVYAIATMEGVSAFLIFGLFALSPIVIIKVAQYVLKNDENKTLQGDWNFEDLEI